MAEVLHLQTQFVVLSCYRCGITFGVPWNRQRALVESGEDFWCPNGHAQAYVEGETDRLKKQLELERKRTEWAKKDAESERARADLEERRARAYKGHLTKVKSRVSNGVCPCCNRTFQNLRRHMTMKHPKYKGDGNG